MGYISVGKEQLHYLKAGTGRRLLLAFHGYGNHAGIFQPMTPYLQNEFTILSFDLPHHGKSTWSDALLTKKDLVQAVEAMKKEYNVEKVSLLGYSLGGRVCMSILEAMPASIAGVTLLATDGLAVNSYYYFFTRTYLGKTLFRHMLEKPEPYFKMLDWLKKRNMVAAGRHKFVMQSLNSAENRDFLLRVWPGLSDLVPAPAKLKAAINKYHIPVAIFMGVHDKIMPPELGEKFRSGLETVQLYVLEKGHRIFDEDNAEQIARSLL